MLFRNSFRSFLAPDSLEVERYFLEKSRRTPVAYQFNLNVRSTDFRRLKHQDNSKKPFQEFYANCIRREHRVQNSLNRVAFVRNQGSGEGCSVCVWSIEVSMSPSLEKAKRFIPQTGVVLAVRICDIQIRVLAVSYRILVWIFVQSGTENPIAQIVSRLIFKRTNLQTRRTLIQSLIIGPLHVAQTTLYVDASWRAFFVALGERALLVDSKE
ncbi:hypothetical protein L1887_61781 [Cichorium endivia]|nr:hypothetical protein L1887_61781 [Cichorium endivia]